MADNMIPRPTRQGPLPGGLVHARSEASPDKTRNEFLYRGHTLVYDGTRSAESIWAVRVFVDENPEPVATAFFDATKPVSDMQSTLHNVTAKVYAAVELMDAPHLGGLP